MKETPGTETADTQVAGVKAAGAKAAGTGAAGMGATGTQAGCPCQARACLKIALIVALALGAAVLLSRAVDGPALDELKHSLSIGAVIALVLIANLVSFACFLVLYGAYRWVRRDLAPRREDGFDG